MNCKKCITNGSEVTQTIGKAQNSSLSCDFCDYSTKAKYNMQRHMDRKHGDAEKNGTSSKQERKKPEVTLDTLLNSIGLENYAANFLEEKVDLKLILDLSEEDMRRLLVDFNIKWGDRYRFEKAINEVKESKPVEKNGNGEDSHIHIEQNTGDALEPSGETLLQEHTEVSDMDIPLDEESSDVHITLQSDTTEEENESGSRNCSLCETAEKESAYKHYCRKCGKVVCSVFCSDQDLSSDNETHRVHKKGDPSCILSAFVCPFCERTFNINHALQVHLKETHTPFETSFPTMSLASGMSILNVNEKCDECGKEFANELDLKNHKIRVHEYGEQFALYPCEDCGYSGTELRELKKHTEEEHTDDSLQSLGIDKLPEVSKRRRHDFDDLAIDEEGNINFEEEDDEFDAHSEELLLIDDEDEWSKPETPLIKTKRKATINHDEPRAKKKKTVVEKNPTKSNLQCPECGQIFTRKDNLSRHVKNKHKNK